jgi:hypothetical protein
MLPTTMSMVDFKYASLNPKEGHTPAMTKAGSVKMAPAATDSPIEPAVRAMFSSRMEPLKRRRNAMLMTAAGYVAAMVWPARRPRYALAAPRTRHMSSPGITARRVSSFMEMCSGTKGL